MLIVVGLFFLLLAYVSWDDARMEFGFHAESSPLWWQFWIPHSYDVVIVTEYALAYMIISTTTLTAGIIITVQEKLKNHDPLRSTPN